MQHDLFTLPEKLPEAPGSVPMFETMRFGSMSHRDEAFANALEQRQTRFARAFRMKAEPQDDGDRLVLREGRRTLEIFKPSDSVWWTDSEVAYRETLPKGAKLPDPKAAEDLAAKQIDKLELDMEHAELDGIGHDEFAVQHEEKETPELVQTAVNVNYRFHLDGVPVLGPGAKAQVSLVEDGRVSDLLHFWRAPRRVSEQKVITPEEALQRFMNDPSFFRLSPEDALVQVHGMRFGYYAIPPDEFQRYLVPVWEVTATVRTRALERYDFSAHVVATTLSMPEVKRLDAVSDPAACRMFE